MFIRDARRFLTYVLAGTVSIGVSAIGITSAIEVRSSCDLTPIGGRSGQQYDSLRGELKPKSSSYRQWEVPTVHVDLGDLSVSEGLECDVGHSFVHVGGDLSHGGHSVTIPMFLVGLTECPKQGISENAVSLVPLQSRLPIFGCHNGGPPCSTHEPVHGRLLSNAAHSHLRLGERAAVARIHEYDALAGGDVG